MMNKPKYFNRDFIPMQVPVIDGIEHLDNIEMKDFPLYCAPYVDGVKLVIRHGLIHFNGIQIPFQNLFFREKYIELRNIALKYRYSIHCTVASKKASNEELIAILSSYNLSLPSDLHLYVTDLFCDAYADKMITEARIANISVVLDKELSNKEDLTLSVPSIALSVRELYSLAETYSITCPHFSGVMLFKSKGEYVSGLATSVTAIRLTKEKEYTILSFTTCKIRYYGRETLVVKDVIVRNGMEHQEIDITNLPVPVRQCMYMAQANYLNHTITVRGLELPRFPYPKFLEFVKLH